jgi:hypothetical protein
MTSNLAPTIDRMGDLKAAMADLEREYRALKDGLAELPVGSYEGERYRLTVTAPEREQTSEALKEDIKEVVDAFRATLSRQYLAVHAPKVACPTFTVRARAGLRELAEGGAK